MKAIGLVELNSVAKGYEASDAMLKEAKVELLTCVPVCPGKFICLISGDVAEVKSAVNAGEKTADENFIDSMVIANVDKRVIPAILGTTVIEEINAVGIIETFSLAACIVAADQAVKAAEVELIEVRLGKALGGKAFALVTGEVAAVRAAMDTAKKQVTENDIVLNTVVIPQPHPDMLKDFM